MSEKTMNEVIKHETVLRIIEGNDKDQNQPITLPMLLEKLTKYEKGRMLLLQKEEYDIVLNYIKQQQEITKALTPPTAEEVCEALEKYVEYGEVKYNNNEFYIFQDKKRYSISNYAYKNQYQIYAYLPPHLITLIGRFYESVVSL